MLRAFHHGTSQKTGTKIDTALGVASRNENCVNFYK